MVLKMLINVLLAVLCFRERNKWIKGADGISVSTEKTSVFLRLFTRDIFIN
jgi:hypothetical protein